jgi:hypothetical protein
MAENAITLLFWGVFIVVIIYLIIRRKEEAKKEDFKDRDN